MMVAANLDAPDWRRADLTLAAPLVAAAGAGGLAALCTRLARRLETAAPLQIEELPSAGLRASERAAWVGVASSRAMGLVTLACLGAAGLGLLLAGAAVWVPLLVCGAVNQAFTSVRVSVDATGVRIAYGWLRRPSTRIDIDSVRRATAIDVKPSAWGGWGYRGSLRLNGRAAVVVRAGEALRLDLHKGGVFVVTVDGAATAAGVLNDALRKLGRLDRA